MHVCDDALKISDFKQDGCVYFIKKQYYYYTINNLERRTKSTKYHCPHGEGRQF